MSSIGPTRRWSEAGEAESGGRRGFTESWLPEIVGLAASALVSVAAVGITILGDDTRGIWKGLRSGISSAFVPALLVFLVVEFVADRAVMRTRSGRLERVERLLESGEFLQYVVDVGEYYRRAMNRMYQSRHKDLFDEVVGRALRGSGWQDLAEGRLEFEDQRELEVTTQLLGSVKDSVDAVAFDIEYHQELPGRGYLYLQGLMCRPDHISMKYWDAYLKRILSEVTTLDAAALEGWCAELVKETSGLPTGGVTIRRILVWDTAEKYQEYLESVRGSKIEVKDLAEFSAGMKELFLQEAALQTALGIHCRAREVNRGEDVRDMNIYDHHTVRYSILRIDDNRMHVILSENADDLKRYSSRYGELYQSALLPDSSAVKKIELKHDRPHMPKWHWLKARRDVS